MPIYSYQCLTCKIKDQRLAGLDDNAARCINCGGLMLRLDEDIFEPYFPPSITASDLSTDQHLFVSDPACPWCTGPTPPDQPPRSHKICERHAQELREG